MSQVEEVVVAGEKLDSEGLGRFLGNNSYTQVVLQK